MSAGKVTKIDLVEAVYEATSCEKRDIQKITDALLCELKAALSQGSTVELRGFGTFEPRLRKGRSKARNPKTGEEVSVADRYTAVFRAGAELKNALRSLPVTD